MFFQKEQEKAEIFSIIHYEMKITNPNNDDYEQNKSLEICDAQKQQKQDEQFLNFQNEEQEQNLIEIPKSPEQKPLQVQQTLQEVQSLQWDSWVQKKQDQQPNNNNDLPNPNNNNDQQNGEKGPDNKIKQSAIFGTAVSASVTSAVALTTTEAGLSALGFSSIGPVAGSVAAAAQSFLGNVAAGGFFASMQSMAMTGATLTAGPVAAIAGGVGIVAGGAYYWYKKRKQEKENPVNPGNPENNEIQQNEQPNQEPLISSYEDL